MERKLSEFSESDKPLTHESGQFKDPVSHLCPASAVVLSWGLTLEAVGSKSLMTNIFVAEFTKFSGNILGKIQLQTSVKTTMNK